MSLNDKEEDNDYIPLLFRERTNKTQILFYYFFWACLIITIAIVAKLNFPI